jgi:hypothetical protein
MGTSLKVGPVNTLIYENKKIPQILINKSPVGPQNYFGALLFIIIFNLNFFFFFLYNIFYVFFFFL